ncbi:MAG: SRPBCC domain-containing protein [Candidatus Dormibacteria bacterium]
MTAETALRALTLTRTFTTPRQLVWDAYTVPEQLAKWWGPHIMHAPLEMITIDLRVGGAFHLTMVSDLDGTRYPSEMTFRAIVPLERLVFAWETQGHGIAAGQISVTLTEVHGATLLVHDFVGHISDEMFPMMEQGTNEELDKLAAVLDSVA